MAAAPNFSNTEVYSGNLQLQGRLNKAWKSRFFVLQGPTLFCYATAERAKLKGSLNIGGCSLSIRVLSPTAGESPSGKSSGVWGVRRTSSSPAGVILSVEPVKGRKWDLRVPTFDEASAWQRAIEQQSLSAPATPSPKKQAKKSSASAKTPPQNGPQLVISPSPPVQKSSSGKRTPPIIETPLWHDLESADGAVRFLGAFSADSTALLQAGRMVDHFIAAYDMGNSSLPDEFRLEAWKGTLRRIAKTLADQLLDCNPSLATCHTNQSHMQQLNLACETWALCQVHSKVMNSCMLMSAEKDAELDSVLFQLAQVDPAFFGVREHHRSALVGDAVQCLRALNRLRTPIEKAVCLRKTVACITDGIQEAARASAAGKEESAPCTDDLLSLLLVVMAKAQVKHLSANALYIEHFLHLQTPDGVTGELAYHLTNFSAACEYLRSDHVAQLCASVLQQAAPKLEGYQSAKARASVPSRPAVDPSADMDYWVGVAKEPKSELPRLSGPLEDKGRGLRVQAGSSSMARAGQYKVDQTLARANGVLA